MKALMLSELTKIFLIERFKKRSQREKKNNSTSSRWSDLINLF